MSWKATAWARDKKAGSPGAKLVLLLLADFANDNGECWGRSISNFAEVSEQSPDTVRRRLRELEERGLIERMERYNPSGTRLADLFRLLMDQTEPSDGADGGQDTLADCEGTLATCEGDPSTAARGTLATVRGQVNNPSLNPSINPTPLAPQGALGGGIEHGNLDSQFDAFRSGYDPNAAAGGSWVDARQEWAKLGSVDRAEALLRLPRYLDDCKAKSRKLSHPASYLRRRLWEGFNVAPKSDETAARSELDPVQRAVEWAVRGKDRETWVFVAEGTPEWAEWHAAFTHAGRPFQSGARVMAADGTGGWETRIGRSFPLKRPPRLHDPPPPGAAE